MATWIAHLRVADSLALRFPGLDAASFAIGNVAPDSGTPNHDWSAFTPPAEVTHFLQRDREPFPCDDAAFYNRCLRLTDEQTMDPERRSFQFGYLCHLLVDNLWRLKVLTPTRKIYNEALAAEPGLIWTIKRDWYGIDFEFLLTHDPWAFWQTFRQASYKGDLIDWIPRQTICEKLAYIKEFYDKDKAEMGRQATGRPMKYLTVEEMDQFVITAAQQIIPLLDLGWLGKPIPSIYEGKSLLDLEIGAS